MSLYLVAPGKRKGNTYWLVRGTLGGRRYEISTKTRDREFALKVKAEIELELLGNRVPITGEDISFAHAANLYSAWRDPSDADRGRIEHLCAVLGKKMIHEIRQADLVDTANRLCPGKSPATKNREVMRMAAAILHYAARQDYCGWLRVALFKEPRPKTRAVSQDVARTLINSVPDRPAYKTERTPEYIARAEAKQRKKRLLLLWLFRQGTRITDALQLETEHLDMQRRVFRLHIGKTDEWIEAPLHDEVFAMLASDLLAAGYIFPWRTKSAVYAWLKPYAKSLAIDFTPHMARHSLGKWLNEDGASLRQIMDTLRHADPKSSIRYQSTDIEVIRESGRRLGKLVK